MFKFLDSLPVYFLNHTPEMTQRHIARAFTYIILGYLVNSQLVQKFRPNDNRLDQVQGYFCK